MSVASALAHEARIELLRSLIDEGDATLEVLCSRTGLAARAVEQHSKVLLELGMVTRLDEDKLSVLADTQTLLEPLLLPKRQGSAARCCSVMEDQTQVLKTMERVNVRLGRQDVNYYLYNGDELANLFDWLKRDAELMPEELCQRGVDMRLLTTITEENLPDVRRLAQWFDIRHLPKKVLDFRFIIKGANDVFFWFTRRRSKNDNKRLCAHFHGEDFQNAFYAVFITLWVLSTQLPDRVAEIREVHEDD